jgi:hypothetical protein
MFLVSTGKTAIRSERSSGHARVEEPLDIPELQDAGQPDTTGFQLSLVFFAFIENSASKASWCVQAL